jgi:hypothetical protein
VSAYTSGLRKKLTVGTDFGEEYDQIFGGFADKKLPKDDLYYSIKDEIESKVTISKKEKKKGKNPDANLLPTVHANNQDKLTAD